MVETITIRRAIDGDLGELLALLAAVELPDDGVREFLDGFVVARDPAGRLVGAAGVERHGGTGLLRSVAVAPGLQRSGLGSRLVAHVLDEAAGSGLDEIVLLTTTARTFFAERFGFHKADRSAYDATLAASPEWRLPRCSSAAFLRRSLRDVAQF